MFVSLRHRCTLLNPEQWQKLSLDRQYSSTENYYLAHKMPQIKFHVPLMATHYIMGTQNLKKKIR